MEKFYMIWVEGTRGPAVTHEDIGEAKREAERLARESAGKRVYTLEAKSYCQIQVSSLPVVWRNIE